MEEHDAWVGHCREESCSFCKYVFEEERREGGRGALSLRVVMNVMFCRVVRGRECRWRKTKWNRWKEVCKLS